MYTVQHSHTLSRQNSSNWANRLNPSTVAPPESRGQRVLTRSSMLLVCRGQTLCFGSRRGKVAYFAEMGFEEEKNHRLWRIRHIKDHAITCINTPVLGGFLCLTRHANTVTQQSLLCWTCMVSQNRPRLSVPKTPVPICAEQGSDNAANLDLDKVCVWTTVTQRTALILNMGRRWADKCNR